LRVDRDRLRRIIHRLKAAHGLGGADAVEIDITTGDVFGPPDDECLGNLHEEP